MPQIARGGSDADSGASGPERPRGEPGSGGRREALGAALSDDSAPRYSVGQAAELLGVAPWYLRRLDALGVVSPGRSGGAQRRYSTSQLGRLADAKAMMDGGVSAEGARRLLEMQDKVNLLQAQLEQARNELRARESSQAMPEPEPSGPPA
ncbi:MAG: MerR family transcriptional regulator [Acidimicrobiales bacterium]